MLQVLKLFVASRNAAIKEVDFPAELGPSYVYASPEAIQEAVDKFLGIEASGGPRGSLDEADAEVEARRSKGKKGEGEAKQKPQLARPKPPGSDGLVAAGEAGEAGGEDRSPARSTTASRSSTRPGLPSGAAYVESNPNCTSGPARLPLQGHRWQPPRRLPDGADAGTSRRRPLLRRAGDPGLERPADPRGPSITETIHGREYEIFLDGDRIRWSPGTGATTPTGSRTACCGC